MQLSPVLKTKKTKRMKYLYFNTKNPYKITINSLEKKEISGVNYSNERM